MTILESVPNLTAEDVSFLGSPVISVCESLGGVVGCAGKVEYESS